MRQLGHNYSLMLTISLSFKEPCSSFLVKLTIKFGQVSWNLYLEAALNDRDILNKNSSLPAFDPSWQSWRWSPIQKRKNGNFDDWISRIDRIQIFSLEPKSFIWIENFLEPDVKIFSNVFLAPFLVGLAVWMLILTITNMGKSSFNVVLID